MWTKIRGTERVCSCPIRAHHSLPGLFGGFHPSCHSSGTAATSSNGSHHPLSCKEGPCGGELRLRWPFAGAPWPLGLSIFRHRRIKQPSRWAQANRASASQACLCHAECLFSSPGRCPRAHILHAASFLRLVGIICLDREWVWGKILPFGALGHSEMDEQREDRCLDML